MSEPSKPCTYLYYANKSTVYIHPLYVDGPELSVHTTVTENKRNHNIDEPKVNGR